MNDIVTAKGEYLSSHFTGSTGTWNLIGSECETRKPIECIDTFINRQTGKYKIIQREDVKKLAETKKIWL